MDSNTQIACITAAFILMTLAAVIILGLKGKKEKEILSIAWFMVSALIISKAIW